MSLDRAPEILSPPDLCRPAPDGWWPRVDRARLDALGDGQVVLAVPGLTPSALAGLPWGREHLRGLVTELTGDLGETKNGEPCGFARQVVLELPLLRGDEAPWDFVETLQELSRLLLRGRDRVTVRWSPSPEPGDPWVAAAGEADTSTPTAALAQLQERWRARWASLSDDDPDKAVGEALVRRLDDQPRRMVFELLKESWLFRADDWPLGPALKPRAKGIAERWLGEERKWLKAFRQFTYSNVRRLVIIPTWQCELRCAYCFIPKQDGRVMPPATIRRSVDFLMSTEEPEVALQFFGGEALLEYDNVRLAITYAQERARAVGKRVTFVLSSNGWSLTSDKVAWLAANDVRMELSLDGDRRTQEKFRAGRYREQSSYTHSIATHAEAILSSGIEQWVIMVVHPTNVDAMPDNFFHLMDMGFKHIQINNMLGRVWTPEQMQSFAKGLHRIGRGLIERWDRGEEAEFINMRHAPVAMRLNGEVTVDFDGTIYGGNQFLHETEHKHLFAVGHLDDLTNIDRYWVAATDNNFLLDWAYRPHVTANNVEVGKIVTSFIKWMKGLGYGPDGPIREVQVGGIAGVSGG